MDFIAPQLEIDCKIDTSEIIVIILLLMLELLC